MPYMREDSPIQNSPTQIRMPLIIALTLAGGIFLGATMFGRTSQKANDGVQKIKEILSYIEQSYVDTVNTETLVNYSIDKLLEKLDPHSAYIPAKDVVLANSQLEGDFEGIGVEFNIFHDTIHVVAPIAGGPSEAVGVQAGDKIISANGKGIAGAKVKPDTRQVFGWFRGKKGSEVKIGIIRRGEQKVRYFTIKRDKIPTHPVEVALMVDEQTGFLKVSRFSANTYAEFKTALKDLKKKGMKRLILDLRDNPGGYLDRAVNMVDELLAGKGKIVYTDGKGSRFDSESRAKIDGMFEQGAVIVLINEGSASASEIMAGALQDHDRALLVGRRTFGKGLVQMPIDLADGSELRLTISRYYTPSGRSIQKPYESYENDMKKRFEKGEMYSKDSIKQDKNKQYTTTHGRKVYGGGGIVPDVFVALDSNRYNYLNQLYEQNIVREYALYYTQDNLTRLKAMGLPAFLQDFQATDAMFQSINDMAQKAGIKAAEKDIIQSKKIIQLHIKALIARQLWQNEGFYPVILQDDEIYQEAIKHFGEAEKLTKFSINR
jgi:carboxyl-terminal processing protease